MEKIDGYFYPEENSDYKNKAILFGVDYDPEKDFEHSMEELKGLAKACNMEIVGVLTQSLPHPDNALYLGRGKVSELKDYVASLEADFCLCEGDLTPSQMKNLQDMLKVPVWDHTNLILEIFSGRAKTKEAKLQVESAYLQFMLPRLTGMWQHLSRQGGGGGSRANKGEGEKQIELDKRYINHRMAELSKELDQITRTRQVQRDGRKKDSLPNVAMVGYTNAGKSTLMNSLLEKSGKEKKVFEKDMLFATLDTSIRKVNGKNNRDFLLSDTVGFIENLPHSLIKAFRSTLEEAKYADLLLIVLDASDPYNSEHKKVTEDTLRELGADSVPRIYVMNKSDLIEGEGKNIISPGISKVYLSAATGEGIDELLEAVDAEIYGDIVTETMLISYKDASQLNYLRNNAHIVSEEYLPEGTKIVVEGPKRILENILLTKHM